MYSPTVSFAEYLQGEHLKYPELTRDAIETLKQSLANDNLPPITGEWWFFRGSYAQQTDFTRHAQHNELSDRKTRPPPPPLPYCRSEIKSIFSTAILSFWPDNKRIG